MLYCQNIMCILQVKYRSNYHVSLSKKVDVDPSTAFCGIPPSLTELCMGALPAATFKTEKDKKTE